MSTKNVESNDSQKTPTIHQRRMAAKRLLASDEFEASFQNTMYKTISISTIMAKLRKAHAQAGILMETGAIRDLERNVFTNAVGKQLTQYQGQITITLRNPDEPDDIYETEITACAVGIEADDKYPAKLYTAATKIFARMEYAISDVSDKDLDIDSVADYNTVSVKPTESYGGAIPKSTFQMTPTEPAQEQKPVELKPEPVSLKKLQTPETPVHQTASEQANDAISKFKPADSKLKIHVVPKETIEEVK